MYSIMWSFPEWFAVAGGAEASLADGPLVGVERDTRAGAVHLDVLHVVGGGDHGRLLEQRQRDCLLREPGGDVVPDVYDGMRVQGSLGVVKPLVDVHELVVTEHRWLRC